MRSVRFVAVSFAALLAASVCFGQTKGPETGGMGMRDSSMMMKDSTMERMMMMHRMMPQTMTATSDGGIVVLSGNRLLKYDKDLNFVKEAEVKMDTLAMQKMMMKMPKGAMTKPVQKTMPIDTTVKKQK